MAARAPHLEAGAYYWVALDDGVSFDFIDGLGAGPHLARLDYIDGEWLAVLCGRAGGRLYIGSTLNKRIVQGSWDARSLWGRGVHQQEVKVTWLARVEGPPPLPEEVEE